MHRRNSEQDWRDRNRAVRLQRCTQSCQDLSELGKMSVPSDIETLRMQRSLRRRYGDMYRVMDESKEKEPISRPGEVRVYWILRDKMTRSIVSFITEPMPTDNPVLANFDWAKVDPPLSLRWLNEFGDHLRQIPPTYRTTGAPSTLPRPTCIIL